MTYHQRSDYRIPKRLKNENGADRKVGIELEFAGLDIDAAAIATVAAIGGKVVQHSEHSKTLIDTDIGDVELYLDFQYVHGTNPEKSSLINEGRSILGKAVSGIVPFELVTKPLPMTELHKLDYVTNALTRAGATGTQEQITSSFGLHLNPELGSTQTGYLLDIVRSMITLEPAVRAASSTDISRSIMGWAKSYSPDFTKLVMDPAYDPDLETFIQDYVELNNGRNYHLDMLPAFRHIAPDTVDALLGEKFPAERPTFHYRLPNSEIGDPSWTISKDWNHWVTIENFAEEISTQHLEKWQETNQR